MGLPKKLTEQQVKFANLLISEQGRKTATQCAIEAGYAKDSARQAASKLQNPKLFPLVVQYIGELREECPSNLTIRFSGTMIDQPALKAWPNTSTVSTDPEARTCPAPDQNNECGDCRACWDGDVKNVAYGKH